MAHSTAQQEGESLGDTSDRRKQLTPGRSCYTPACHRRRRRRARAQANSGKQGAGNTTGTGNGPPLAGGAHRTQQPGMRPKGAENTRRGTAPIYLSQGSHWLWCKRGPIMATDDHLYGGSNDSCRKRQASEARWYTCVGSTSSTSRGRQLAVQPGPAATPASRAAERLKTRQRKGKSNSNATPSGASPS